jgi:hypothetical protein
LWVRSDASSFSSAHAFSAPISSLGSLIVGQTTKTTAVTLPNAITLSGSLLVYGPTTLGGNITLNAFTGTVVTGTSVTVVLKQDATGSRTLTSTMKFAGGEKTLTTAANSVDIISVFYDGTNYWASLSKDFK